MPFWTSKKNKPSSAEIDEIRRGAAALIWYHTIDLGHGIVTPGIYDTRPYLKHYGLPRSLKGKTALDIGAASGYFTFELERRGAAATATDLPAWMEHDFGPGYTPDLSVEQARSYLHDPFLFARSVLNSAAERKEINIYDITPQSVGTFDFVLCASVLLHLTDPVKALRRIRSVTKEQAIIATAVRPDAGSDPTALFIGHAKADTWWLPNRACFEAMVKAAGFAKVEWVSEFQLDFRDGKPGHQHGVVRAWV